ncbi:MAG: hypothetical protein U5L96_10610 [Owenweeksia sp.]|nr:hypothetical protein [Owenweeksia sp.]
MAKLLAAFLERDTSLSCGRESLDDFDALAAFVMSHDPSLTEEEFDADVPR